jgi:hypothetical protein
MLASKSRKEARADIISAARSSCRACVQPSPPVLRSKYACECRVASIHADGAVEPILGETIPFARSCYLGPRQIDYTSVEHSCEISSMNGDVPARKAEGRARSLYAVQISPSRLQNRLWLRGMASRYISFLDNWMKKFQETTTLLKRLRLGS